MRRKEILSLQQAVVQSVEAMDVLERHAGSWFTRLASGSLVLAALFWLGTVRMARLRPLSDSTQAKGARPGRPASRQHGDAPAAIGPVGQAQPSRTLAAERGLRQRHPARDPEPQAPPPVQPQPPPAARRDRTHVLPPQEPPPGRHPSRQARHHGSPTAGAAHLRSHRDFCRTTIIGKRMVDHEWHTDMSPRSSIPDRPTRPVRVLHREHGKAGQLRIVFTPFVA